MDLDKSVVNDIIDYLKTKDIGASASDISKDLNKNRMTVSKYLSVLKSEGILKNKQIAQAKYWQIKNNHQKPKVLVVDDEKHILELVRLSLIHKDIEIITANDGVEALEKVREDIPDLIILDLMMPRLDGYEVCDMLRQNPKTQHIPIIMLTAKTQLRDKIEGLRTGADDYITKPFNPLELEARIDAVFARYDSSIKMNPVTGLPAYDALLEKLNNTKARIIFFDIQDFKSYNQKEGFNKGNDVLKIISRIIKRSVNQIGTVEDFIAHIGSDDFVILTYGDADKLTELIKSNLESNLREILPNINLSFSFATIDSLDVNEEIKSRDVSNILKKARVTA